MAYEPHLIAPFENSNLMKWYKPWLVGTTAFPQISDAYARRGVVRKREGYRLFAANPVGSTTSLPGSDKPVQGLKYWINPSSLGSSLIAFSLTKSYLFNDNTRIFGDVTTLAFGGPGHQNPINAFNWSNSSNDYFWTSNFAGSMWTTNGIGTAGLKDHIKYFYVGANWSTFTPTVSGTNQMLAAQIILPYKGRLVALNTQETPGAFPNRARWSQLGTPYTSDSAGVTITNITPGATTVINLSDTSSFTLSTPAGITNVVGTIGAKLNQQQFNVSNIVLNTSITIDVNTIGLVYSSGGIAYGAGSVSIPTPFSIDMFAWRDDIVGRGGFVDADTSQQIVSAEIIKDTLIVFFQRSTWRLTYTGNEVLPFIWERLNTEFGAESTYSNIPLEETALAFSRYGWIQSTTTQVNRIDLSIPEDSFAIEGTNIGLAGLNKVQGIRDFYRNYAYWTYLPIGNETASQIYAYNYIDKSWTIFNPTDHINVFGYHRNTEGDLTWALLNASDDTWENYNDQTSKWENIGSAQNIDFPYILGGGINGLIYIMFEFFEAPTTDNDQNFNFSILTKRLNPYFKTGEKCRLGYVDLYVSSAPGGEITLQHFTDEQETPIFTRKVPLYARGVVNISSITTGLITTVTTASPHGLTTGEGALISNIVGSIGNALNNKTFVATVVSTTVFTIPVNTNGYVYTTGGYLYNESLVRGDTKYVRVYLGAVAHMHQILLTLSDDQVADTVKGSAQLEVQGMVWWTRKMGRIRG